MPTTPSMAAPWLAWNRRTAVSASPSKLSLAARPKLSAGEHVGAMGALAKQPQRRSCGDRRRARTSCRTNLQSTAATPSANVRSCKLYLPTFYSNPSDPTHHSTHLLVPAYDGRAAVTSAPTLE
jgi:hypothetical protein